jgi:hypothetical protein
MQQPFSRTRAIVRSHQTEINHNHAQHSVYPTLETIGRLRPNPPLMTRMALMALILKKAFTADQPR